MLRQAAPGGAGSGLEGGSHSVTWSRFSPLWEEQLQCARQIGMENPEELGTSTFIFYFARSDDGAPEASQASRGRGEGSMGEVPGREAGADRQTARHRLPLCSLAPKFANLPSTDPRPRQAEAGQQSQADS